jgi:DNA-binding XRE family transcriptional regulator
MTKEREECLNFLAIFPLSDPEMLKLSFHYASLGSHLKRERKDRKLTQSDLAQKVQVAIPTIRLLENGQGTLSSFWSVLQVLHMEIAGRNLPAGESFGVPIATLRKRRRMRQRALALIIETTQPTLLALERHCPGRLPPWIGCSLLVAEHSWLCPPPGARNAGDRDSAPQRGGALP